MRNLNHLAFWLLGGFTLLTASACIKLGEPYSAIPPGMWRGTLELSQDFEGFDEQSKGQLPFNFEVIYDRPDSFHIVILNGDERIVVTDIRTGVNRRTARDTIRIDFPVYDSHIEAQYEEDAIEGWWVVRNRKDYRIKFKALHGQSYRFFQQPEAPAANLSGKWLCTFGLDTENPSKSIGEFKQDGNRITGTFIASTGDDRYLEGVVSGERLHLSVFDGSHAYLYEAKILPDGQLSGIYRSGNHFKTYWEGFRADTATLKALGDPLALTKLKTEAPFVLQKMDTRGNLIDLNAGPYAGKPKIIQIMGTWCPNCRDETKFLLEYLQKNPNPGFEVIGISFERHADTVKAITAINTYIEKMKIPYAIVYGGPNDKTKASAALPQLEKVIAYPTLLFLNSRNEVVATHTGFTGPATSGYNDFLREFDILVDKVTQ